MKVFKTAGAFRKWLSKNHAAASELVIRFYKVGSGRGGMTYPQAVDEALCYGWIDGVRRGVDGESYSIRFTPRKKDSIWSAVNLRNVERLMKAGRMAEPGLETFRSRNPARSRIYSFENQPRELSPEFLRELRTSRQAWAFFSAQPPWYRRTAAFWVMSAKREGTQRARLAKLIESSTHGQRAPPFSY